jgi:hypothetical protein
VKLNEAFDWLLSTPSEDRASMPTESARTSSDPDVVHAFKTQVLRPLLAAGAVDPAATRQTIAELQDKLRSLVELLDGAVDSPPRSTGLVNGLLTSTSGAAPTANGHEPLADIGRNQRSRVRELVLLEALSRETRPFTLAQLMSELESRGFHDGQAAVVSQLHRMKHSGTIEQPGNGMYAITHDGLVHLRSLRASVGALIR